MTARLMAACLLAAGALVSGCQSTVDGTPQADAGNPSEPSFPTPRPSRTIPSTPSTPPPSTPPPPTPAPTPTAAPGTQVLAPENGYVFIATKSGLTHCQISTAEVACEAPFVNPPKVDDEPANGVRVTAAGQPKWVVGNLGDIPVVTIDYRTYAAVGWTIDAREDGTRFTNDGTGHGMFVAIGGVDVF